VKKIPLLISFFSQLAFSDVVIIVNKSNNNQINAEDISRLFLRKVKTFSNGAIAIPVIQIENSTTTEEFNAKVLERTSQQLKTYWSRMIFTGKGLPPKEVLTDAEMINFIEENPNAIGYINSTSVDTRVRVVAQF
jgi:ABC-type phosphate transport system substrate-binding protein